MTAGSKQANWRGGLAVLLALATCLPVVMARYPQMSDYPAHLARYAVMLDAMRGTGPSADLARYYGFQWAWTGNLGVDLLIRPFAALFGLEGGGRVIAGLIPPLTGLGLLAVDKVLRGRITLASLLAMPFVWSPMMLIGLMNFALGQALALWTFALWVLADRRGWAWALRVPLFAGCALVVWLCHLSAWGVLGIMVFGYELTKRPLWRAFLLPAPLAAPVAVMALIPGTASSFSYGRMWWIYKQAIWMKATRDTSYVMDMGWLVAVMLLLALAILWRRLDLRLALAGGLLLVLSIAVPRPISGGDYADFRLISAGLMICALAMEWGDAVWGWALAGLHGALRLALTTASWQADSAATERMLGALDAIPQGARVASAVVVERGQWPLNHFEHIGAYAVVRRHALVNANFAVAHVHMLQVRGASSRFVDPSQRILVAPSQKIDLAHFAPAREADYLWYVGARAPDTMPQGAQVIWRGDRSFVARLAPVKPELAISFASH